MSAEQAPIEGFALRDALRSSVTRPHVFKARDLYGLNGAASTSRDRLTRSYCFPRWLPIGRLSALDPCVEKPESVTSWTTITSDCPPMAETTVFARISRKSAGYILSLSIKRYDETRSARELKPSGNCFVIHYSNIH